MIELVIALATIPFQGIISYFYFALFLKRKNEKRFIIGGVFLYFFMQFVITFLIARIENIILVLGTNALCSAIIYQGKIRIKLLLTALFLLLLISAETISAYIMYMSKLEIGFLQIQVFSVLVTYVLVIVIKVIWNSKHSQDSTSVSASVGIILGALCSMLLVHSIYSLTESENSSKSAILAFFNTLLLLMVNLGAYKLMEIQNKKLELSRYNIAYEKQLELHQHYIKEKQESDEFLKRFVHDYKHKWVAIEQMISESDDEKLKRLLDELSIPLIEQKKIINTGNIIIDSIINSKYRYALENEIIFSIDIQVPKDIMLPMADFCIILGNILDNSFEATEQVKDERNIYLAIKYYSNSLYILLENPFSGNRKKNKEGYYMTTKENKSNHGIGLKSVEETVHKNGGIIRTEENGNKFIVKIAFN